MANRHEYDAEAAMTELLLSGKYSDFTIVCGERHFRVHRSIICPRSEYFTKLCDGPFSESQTRTMIMEEVDPETVQRMLLYLYTQNYDDGGKSFAEDLSKAQEDLGKDSEKDLLGMDRARTLHLLNMKTLRDDDDGGDEDSSPGSTRNLATNEEVQVHTLEQSACLLANVRVYALGSRLFIPSLCTTAAAKFALQAARLWRSKDFPEAIREIYSSTPPSDRRLRDVVVKLCAKELKRLLTNDAFRAVLEDEGSFAMDLMDRKMESEKVFNRADKMILKSFVAKDKESRTTTIGLREENSLLREQRLGLVEQLEEAKHKIAELIRMAKKVDECQSCKMEFGMVFERKRGDVIVRCRSCSTKQQ